MASKQTAFISTRQARSKISWWNVTIGDTPLRMMMMLEKQELWQWKINHSKVSMNKCVLFCALFENKICGYLTCLTLAVNLKMDKILHYRLHV